MEPRYYTADKWSRLKYQFSEGEIIDKNYSQVYQDMFVLTMLNGKRNGTFLEIGSGLATFISNTYLLETKFDWKGISLDLLPENIKSHVDAGRKNIPVCADAIKTDYEKLLGEHSFPMQIDYLQIDIDPATAALNCLGILPLEKYRFSVVTFEHDVYRYGAESLYVKTESRRIFRAFGYELVVGNICNEGPHDPFEDWWIDPNVISKDMIKLFQTSEDFNMNGEDLLLKP